MDRNKTRQVIWDYFVLTFGTILYVMAWESFLIPHDIASGGLTGACTIIQFATGIQVSYSFFMINLVLLGIGFVVLGKGFGIRTIYAILISTILFKIVPDLPILQSIPGQPLYIENKILITVVGGLMEALGIGLIFLRGGSTGGTDIIVLIINKFWPVSVGKVYLYTDIFIIASVLLIPGKTVEDMLYGYVTMIVFSYMVDFVVLGGKSTVKMLIFSDKYEEISEYIIKNMDRGVTALNAVGMYTKEPRKVLVILLRTAQLPEITKVIKQIDKKAFVSISNVSSVYGEGFEEMKTGISSKNNKQNKK